MDSGLIIVKIIYPNKINMDIKVIQQFIIYNSFFCNQKRDFIDSNLYIKQNKVEDAHCPSSTYNPLWKSYISPNSELRYSQIV